MMPNAGAVVDRRLVGADVDAPVDRRGVTRDDLAVDRARECDAERGLAGSRRADDGEERVTGQGVRSL
jgi:hypothetical protein